MNENHLTSPYRRGADNGILMGLYMAITCCVWSIAVFNADTKPLLGIVGVALALGVPILLFVMLRRSYVKDGGRSQMSALWMEGIMTFIFGAVIALLAGYVYMRYIEPDYLHNLYELMHRSMLDAAKAASGLEAQQYRQIADNFRGMMERGEMPSILGLLVDMMWGITFSGCILSLVVALIVKAVKVRRKQES